MYAVSPPHVMFMRGVHEKIDLFAFFDAAFDEQHAVLGHYHCGDLFVEPDKSHG
jgi:hypothetical protein